MKIWFYAQIDEKNARFSTAIKAINEMHALIELKNKYPHAIEIQIQE